jgi:thioesterase domain-containing protein
MTIEKLAASLREENDASQWSSLVPIQTEGPRTPFFCIHPAGGNVLCYLQLSQQLGSDQPFYGLQAPGVDGIREPLASVPEMASEYLEAIRRVQPRGPYAVGGWSFGGIVAYEIAQQIRAAGEDMQLLAIIDAGVLYAMAVLLSFFPKGEMGVTEALRLPTGDQLERFRRRTAPAGLVPEDADETLATWIFRVFVSNMRATFDYRPEPYDGKLTLFQAHDKIVQTRHEPHREWRRQCREVERVNVSGNHLTVVHEPHVRELAAGLRDALEV